MQRYTYFIIIPINQLYDEIKTYSQDSRDILNTAYFYKYYSTRFNL